MGSCSDGDIGEKNSGTKTSVAAVRRELRLARASVDATSTAARTMAKADLSQTLRGRGM